MSDPLLKMDERGRVTIGNAIRKNGIEPSDLWSLTFGPNQKITLTPVVVTASTEGVPA